MSKKFRKGQIWRNKDNDTHLIQLVNRKDSGWTVRKINSGLRESHKMTEFILKKFYILVEKGI